MIKVIILLGLAQTGYNFFYYGVQGSLERTGYSFGVSIALVGVHEFIGFMTACTFINKYSVLCFKIAKEKGVDVSQCSNCNARIKFFIIFC